MVSVKSWDRHSKGITVRKVDKSAGCGDALVIAITNRQSGPTPDAYPSSVKRARTVAPAEGVQMRRVGTMSRRRLAVSAALAVTALVTVAGTSASGAVAHHGFRQINLVSDIPGKAQLTDPNLVNPWGLAAGPTTPLWVADNGTDVATLYAGAVHGSPVSQVPLVVSVPGGAPTGQVFNPTSGFKLRVGDTRVPAKFIFDSEAGTITAWTLTDPVQTSARTKLTVPGAVFKGLALSFFGHHPALYATDFVHNKVVVVDSQFHRIATPGLFRDAMLPAHYAPFGIQAIGNTIVVSYAKQQAGSADEQDGAGLGLVDVYSRNGVLISRLVSHGRLNAPWGLVRAPAGFGRFGGALLVGNFGDGRINAYDSSTGEWLGLLHRPGGRPLAIQGLWGLTFGNGVTGSPSDLLFSAGIDDEAHGLLGEIRHVG
ncbi:MAG: hypothetical protein QOG02_1561 [Gaiellales bacterium]|nr:hypothetical protein [Gaiellales bacterium]